MRLVKQITVERVSKSELAVSVRPDEYLGAPCVYVAGRWVGYALPEVEYPDTLAVVSLHCMGEHIVLCERQLEVGEPYDVAHFNIWRKTWQLEEWHEATIEYEFDPITRRSRRRVKRVLGWHDVPPSEALMVRRAFQTEARPSWRVKLTERVGVRSQGEGSVELKRQPLTFDEAYRLRPGDVLHQEWQDVLQRREVLVERWGYIRPWLVHRLDLSQEEARRRYNEFVRHRAETPDCGRRCHIGDKEPRAIELIELVTDGKIAFPIERPVGSGAWNRWPEIRFAVAINVVNWTLMLRAIEGKYFDGVNTLQALKQATATRRIIERDPERVERVRRSLLAGACFDGKALDTDFDIEVGVGERLLFSGRVGGRPVWVVDSPNWGHALYVFDKEAPARDFANHRITAAEAQQDCAARVIHAGAWESRASSALNARAMP